MLLYSLAAIIYPRAKADALLKDAQNMCVCHPMSPSRLKMWHLQTNQHGDVTRHS